MLQRQVSINMKRYILLLLVLAIITGCDVQKETAIIEEEAEEKSIPEDYFYPLINMEDDYKDGIIYDINTSFNIKNYIDTKCYEDKCYVYFELTDEEKTEYKTIGTHEMSVHVKDMYGNVEKLNTLLFTEDLSLENDEKPSTSGHYEMVLVSKGYDENVPAYDESVLVKESWMEKILVKEGYFEDIEYCKEYGFDTYFGYICSGCGYTCENISDMTNHIESDWEDGCGSYSGQNISYGDRYCLMMDTYQLYHEPEYDYVFHDAEYKTVHHNAAIIHHKDKYKREWVED